MSEIPESWKDLSGRKRHKISLVNDGETVLVISKFWRSKRQAWHYEVEALADIECQIRLRGDT